MTGRTGLTILRMLAVAFLALAFLGLLAPQAHAAPTAPTPPASPSVTSTTGSSGASVNLDPGALAGSNNREGSLTLILLLTLLAIAPSVLLLTSAFTRIIIVLGLVRNGLGMPTIPPNQVIAGLALILTAFVMWPVWTQVNKESIQPYAKDEISASQALTRAQVPMKAWMLRQTSKESLAMFQEMSKLPKPKDAASVSFQVALPAFVLSELKTAFTIGMVVLVAFLAIDLIVTSVLMSLGMMMVPPTVVALPLKILVFVLANGWVLITQALVGGFR